MAEIIKPGVDCCKGARRPRNFIWIEPRNYNCLPGETVKLRVRNTHPDCDGSCWEWDLRSGPGSIFPWNGTEIEYTAPAYPSPNDCLAIIDFYCGGQVIDTAYMTDNQEGTDKLAFMSAGFWHDGGWEGRDLREPTIAEIEALALAIEEKEGFPREPTGAEIEALTVEINLHNPPICAEYEGDPGWCWGMIPTSSCIYLYRYDCGGNILHRDVRTLRAYCKKDLQGVIKIDPEHWWSGTEILTPDAWGPTVTGSFSGCKQGVINSFVNMFISQWINRQSPRPSRSETLLKVRNGDFLIPGGFMDFRSSGMKRVGCCVPGEV